MKRASPLDGDDEVWVIPVDEDVLVVPVRSSRAKQSGPGFDARAASATAEQLFSIAQSLLAHSGSTVYELSPESQRQLAQLHKNYVGEYFRGVLRRENGHTGHQIQLREVQQAAPNGAEVLMAAQLHSMQLQLERIEELLQDVAQSVADVLSFLEEHQRAKIEAVLDLVKGAYTRARSSGRLSKVDWERLAGIELAVETELRSVLLELDRRLDGVELGETPKDVAKALDQLDPSRLHALFALFGALATALGRWQELVVLRKHEAGEIDEQEVASFRDRLKELADAAEERLNRVQNTASDAAATQPRDWWTRLWSDGLVVGASHDNDHLKQVEGHLTALKRVSESRKQISSAKPVKPVLRLMPGLPDDETAA